MLHKKDTLYILDRLTFFFFTISYNYNLQFKIHQLEYRNQEQKNNNN